MSTITREHAELKSFITAFLSDPAHDNQSSRSMTAEVFRIALGALEAEPAISFNIKDGWPEPNSAAPVVGAERLSDGVHELYTAPPATEITVRELTMWVKRLAHSLRNAKSGSKLPDDAMAYLSAKGLIGVEDALR